MNARYTKISRNAAILGFFTVMNYRMAFSTIQFQQFFLQLMKGRAVRRGLEIADSKCHPTSPYPLPS
jgi:hypothetical protein